MKILMIAPQPFFEPRGTPFSVLGRLKGLSELGHEVDLLTYHIGKNVPIPGVTIHRTPRLGFIKSVRIGPSGPKMLLDVLLLFKAIWFLLRRRYDLIHTHEEASFFGIILAKLFIKPHLYDMHSSPTEQLSNFKYTRLRLLVRAFDWIERRVINSSSAVITICPALAEHVKAVNSRVPQMMIENVVSERDPASISTKEVESFRLAHPQLKGKKVIFYGGTFETYQGLDLLIESAYRVVAQRDDVTFLMVGGKPEQVEHYQRIVDECELTENFYFTGSRPPEEIPVFVALSDVLLSPRTAGTNTPLKIYSYLESGKPIVATDLYTHTQVLNPNVAMLTAPNPDDFSDGILAIVNDSDMGRHLGHRGRELFEANYSFQTYVEKTESVLRMAMGQ